MAGSQENILQSISRPAARDLSSYQHCAVKVDTDGNCDYANTGGGSDKGFGVLMNKPAAETGAECEIATVGSTAIMKVNGNAAAIAIGDKLGSNGSYIGVKVTANLAAYFAIALEASTALNDLIEVLIVGHKTISA